jgi:diphosphomevalonate decarboxylase
MAEALARANANVALVKHWGERNETLNLPYTGSISITLAAPGSTAFAKTRGDLPLDRVVVNGRTADGAVAARLHAYCELLRGMAATRTRLEVAVHTDRPDAPGPICSASMFAALALATSVAMEMDLSPEQLSKLARRGTGSAACSVFGGFVEWLAGELSDGSDSYAVPLAAPEHWSVGFAIAIIEPGTTDGPDDLATLRGVKRSPYFPSWLAGHDDDLETIRRGILARDLTLVGETMEHNCLKMHAVGLAAWPPLLYWRPATVAVIERVRELRREGLEAYFTIDAGPEVAVLCREAERDAVADELSRVPGVTRVLQTRPGGGPELLATA